MKQLKEQKTPFKTIITEKPLITMLINKKYLSQYSPLPKEGNYNYDEIMNYVSVSEEIWIRPILGDDLFNEIEEQVKNNTVSETNATLLTEGGLYQYLSYAVCLEGLPFIYARFNEAGITLPDMEHSKSVDLKQLTYIEQHLRRQVEFLKDKMIKWLDEHFESFPLYHPTDCQCNQCCNKNHKLNEPNPNYTVFRTKPIKTKVD